MARLLAAADGGGLGGRAGLGAGFLAACGGGFPRNPLPVLRLAMCFPFMALVVDAVGVWAHCRLPL
jgi:hypothetical protein